MAKSLEERRCPVCRQRSLRRQPRPFEYEVSHDGRAPVTIRIPDLEVIACTNPACKLEHADDTVIHDDAATARITEETYRQLGLLTPAEIRAGREKLGMTQQELQELLGLGGNSLSRWENAQIYQSRSLDTLVRLYFDVPAVRERLSEERTPEIVHSATNRKRFQYLNSDGSSVPKPTPAHQFNPRRVFVESSAGVDAVETS